jgi:hypothetical protein
MPSFICTIDRCDNHDGHNCTIELIQFGCRSDDYDVTLECPHQDFTETEKREKEERGW